MGLDESKGLTRAAEVRLKCDPDRASAAHPLSTAIPSAAKMTLGIPLRRIAQNSSVRRRRDRGGLTAGRLPL